MIRKCIVFLVGCLIIDGGCAVNLINIHMAISWGEAIVKFGTQLYSMKKNIDSTSMGELDVLMKDFEEYSHKYDIYLTYVAQKLPKHFTFITNKSNTDEHDRSEELKKFNDLMNSVNHIFNYIKKIRNRRHRVDKIADHFVDSILWGPHNLPNTLDSIRQLIFPSTPYIMPGFMQQTITDLEENDGFDCDKFMSAQQYVYYIYVNLLLAEMQGLTILTYVYSLDQHLVRSIDYATELNTTKNNFEIRVNDYYEYFSDIITLFPRVIHRCDVNRPNRDINFLEFVNYHRIILFDQQRPQSTEWRNQICVPHCQKLDNSMAIVDTYNQKIYNCHYIGPTESVILCPAKPGSTRKYLWWKYDYDTYGEGKTCPTELKRGIGHQITKSSCNVCACSSIITDYRNNAGISRISITSQLSDIENNMVVVGIQFVVYDGAIHLQIKQGNMLSINAFKNSTQWKKLDDQRSNIQSGMYYKTLFECSGQLYLDDVMVPPNYAVTGVRIWYRNISPQGFYLQVRGTLINAEIGKLNVGDTAWFVGGDLLNTADYMRERIAINTDNLKDSSKCTGHDYDSGTNKLIKFQHSSLRGDGGQSTIPYIDAQPVETHTQFPLGGIGLFYRKKSGCGGYVAPRLFTTDMSPYL